MPHSSGGGSHGGGHHSSSHSHSSSGRSSYSGSSGSSTPSATISRKPFKGGRRYVYYARHGRPIYYYSDTSSPDSSLAMSVFVGILFTLLAGGFIYLFVACGLYVPRQLDVNSYDSTIIVDDHVNILDEDTLEPALEKFKEVTGVAPAIEVVTDEEWQEYYTDLETFAYSEYLRMFDDEKHWLVVLSYPATYETDEFIAWSWEGMVGDDCYPAFNSDSEDAFTKIIQSNLLRTNTENISQYLANAYYSFSETAMDVQVGYGFLVVAFAIFLFYIALMWAVISDSVRSQRIKAAYIAPESAKEFNCEYCGSLIVQGTVANCPNCGAPVPASIKNKK